MTLPYFSDLERGVPLTHLGLIFSDGSLGDPRGKEGLTRILFRLLRRCAQGKSSLENDEYLDSLGASISPECNRSSSGWSATVIERHLEETIDYLLSLIENPHFDEKEFNRLITESKAEWQESLDDDSSLARRFFSLAFFEGHDYGNLVAGTPSSLSSLKLVDLENRQSEIKNQISLALSVAGAGTPEALQPFLQRLEQAAPGEQRRTPSLDVTPPNGRQLLFVDKPERSQCQLIIGGLGTHPHDDDFLALQFANTAFGGTFTARLNEEVRAQRGWSYGAYSHLPIDRSRQAFSLWTFPQTKDALPCLQLQLKMLGDFVTHGLTQTEFKRTKKYLKKSYPFQIDSSQKRVSRMLDRWFFELPAEFHESYLENLNSLSLDQVNEAIAHRISSQQQLITLVGSKDELLDKLRGALPELTRTRCISYQAESLEAANTID